MRYLNLVPFAAGLVALAGARPVHSQALTFHPLAPCRIVDTRLWASGTPQQRALPLAAGETRSFDAIATDLRPQGGAATGCGVPPQDVSDLRHRAEAIVVNLIAVNAAGAGDLRVFAGGVGIAPLASVINYTAGQTIAVGTVIPLRTDLVGDDFQIRADVSGTHVVVDVVGYYSRGTATTFLARIRGISTQPAGTATHYYGLPSGLDFAGTTVAEHQMRLPRGCSVRRLQVDESVPVPADSGSRIYTLWGGSAATVPLLTCNPQNGGFCQDATAGSKVPLLSEKVTLEALVTASAGHTVPATEASITFEMVCD